MHQGVDALLTFIRNRFWIIGGRRLVRQVKRRCMRCKRHDSAPCSEVTAPLPVQRIQFERPFKSCGIDYAGPFSVRDGADVCKVWLALLSALHQELFTWKLCEAYRLTIFSWLFVDLPHAETDQTISFRIMPQRFMQLPRNWTLNGHLYHRQVHRLVEFTSDWCEQSKRQ